MHRQSRRWLCDTAGPPIGAVARSNGLTPCRRWRTCWTSFRSGGTNCPPASRAARRRKRSMACWNCGVMSKIFRRSSCQKASDGTDDAHRWRYRTRFGKANGACLLLGRPHKAARTVRSGRSVTAAEPQPTQSIAISPHPAAYWGVHISGWRPANGSYPPPRVLAISRFAKATGATRAQLCLAAEPEFLIEGGSRRPDVNMNAGRFRNRRGSGHNR